MVVRQLAMGIAIACFVIACACEHGSPEVVALSPVAVPTTEPVPPAAPTEEARAAPPACLSERCLANIVDAAAAWTLFDRLGVPDPDSDVWIEPAGRRAYVEAVHLSESDVPARCRPADADCYATWEMRVIGVTPSAEGGCPRATLELQLLLEDDGASDPLRVGSPRRFEDDFVGLDELDARTCESVVDDVEHDRAARATAPATPMPTPTAPMACTDLASSIAVFAGTRSGDALVLTHQLSGPADDVPFPRTYALDAADLDGDGTEEGVVTITSEVGADGERVQDCGNYGECNRGAVLRCDAGWAMVLAPEYRFELEVGATRTVSDRAFRILVETTRLGGSQADEVERMEEGRPLFSASALVMGRRGYADGGSAEWFESGQCARLFRAGFLADARAMCEQGLVAHPRGRVRGALYYDLGRIAEAEGHVEDARDAYRRSLEARENATVRAHLDALPPP